MDVQKLAKVLALAASDNDSEALHALRTARRLLDVHGYDFVELARHVSIGRPQVASQAGMEELEDTVFDLRNEIRHLRAENERLRQVKPQVPADPVSLAQAADNAAAAIRLRAEMADLRDTLDLERSETLRLRAAEMGLREQLMEALAEAGRMSARIEDLEARRLRVEAENRRNATAATALKADLDEALGRLAALEAERVARITSDELSGRKPRKVAHGQTRAKAPGQFALF